MIQDKEQKINKINLLGYNVVDIEENIYVFSQFNHAENNINNHNLVGQNITSLLNNQSIHINVDDRNTNHQLTTSIDNLPVIKRLFHKDYKYVIYLAC